ncbi:MAG: type II secretion system secretin GspD [Desulfobacterales bacterium]|nr:type II secretion system secretin GspD [Desulfobacterales bacterium]
MEKWRDRKMKTRYSSTPPLQYSSTPALQHSIFKCILSLLCVALWLLASHSVALGARVAGEEGVRPAVVKPPRKAPAPEKLIRAKKKTPPKKEIPSQQQMPAEQATDERYVTIDFDNVDIALFIKFISELTGKNFVVDKGVRGKVTIISPTKISVKEAYKVFESVLEVHGFTTVPAGSVIKIIPAVQARSKNIETRLREEAIDPQDKVVTQLIPLDYANPDDLKKLFAPLISKSSVIISYAPTGILIVTDVLSNIKRLLRIVKVIDVVGIGAEISVIPIEHATATVLVKSLLPVFQVKARPRRKGVPVSPDVKIVADERTNSLIIAATEDDTLRVKQLIKLLDKEIPRGEGDIHVYYLQNANAEDLAKVLMALPSKQAKAPAKGKAPIISKEVQILSDKATNSLVIRADKDDYLVLLDVIEKLDIPRRMVYIEALIMEVNVDKDFTLGVEWRAMEEIGSHDGRKSAGFIGSGGLGGTKPEYGEYQIIPKSPIFPRGFSLGVLGEGITIGKFTFPTIGAVIRAYKKDSDVHILSTPQILTTDNEDAEIYVGENVPYITRAETTEIGRDYSSYEYKDVGVTLKVTPQINQERFVRLKIFQEVIKLKGEVKGDKPTTLKRSAETTVIVKDANSVVIGGIIGETSEMGTYKVPCLGDIPGLGWFFKSVSKTQNKTNLFVFLTPHIIENPEEAKKIFEEKKDEIDRIEEGVIKMYKSREVSD